ncbi:MAG: hypothetical protein ACM3JB_12330 [Acidobacteriaceae bacterium]
MKWLFFAGLGTGTVLGMLVAPRSGRRVQTSSPEHMPKPRTHRSRRSQVPRHEVQAEAQPMESSPEKRDDLMTILNDWPHERLIEIDGIGPVLASKIIRNRPFKSEQDLIESKELPPSAIAALRRAS